MKTKLEMAHDFALKQMESISENSTMQSLVSVAWQYADAMQAEAEKREDKSRPTVLQDDWSQKTNDELKKIIKTLDGIIESRSDCNHEWDHISTYGVDGDYYVCSCGAEKPSQGDWQPDWSQAPDEYDWFVVGGCSGDGFFCTIKPEMVKDHYWFVGEKSIRIEDHSYTGDWRNSLRKRPE